MKIVPAALPAALLALLMSACATSAEPTYQVHFRAHFEPDAGFAQASLTVEQEAAELEWLDFTAPSSQFDQFEGDGKITRSEQRVRWDVPRDGGTLRYRVRVDHKRRGVYDARMTEDWAVLRLDDLFPSARSSTFERSESRSSLELSGPDDWGFETRYGSVDERVRVRDPERRFDRPTGWMIAGRLGIRREKIGHTYVTIAAPKGIGIRRLEVLAFLRWNLPVMDAVFPGLPDRILIVGAPSEMWRGGLSGPGSLYLHADRPLISENATSPMLHEIVHVSTGYEPAEGDDWIVEGLAEYYGLEIMRRSGTISDDRFADAIRWQQRWRERRDGRLADPSTGANTARSVVLFHELRKELEAEGASLDDVVAELFSEPEPNRQRLQRSVEERLGAPSAVLAKALREAPGNEEEN